MHLDHIACGRTDRLAKYGVDLNDDAVRMYRVACSPGSRSKYVDDDDEVAIPW